MPGQYIEGKQLLLSLLAPLFVVDTVALFLTVAHIHPVITVGSAFAVILNSTASMGDIEGAVACHNYPDGTLIYYPEEERDTISFVLKPKQSGSTQR